MNKFFKDALNLIKSYKWNSIFFKYLRVLLLVFIIPAVIFAAILLAMYFSSAESDINTSQRYSIIKSVTQYDKAFDEIDRIYTYILSSPLTTSAANASNTDFSEYAAFLKSEKNRNTYINSISVFFASHQYVASSYGSAYVADFRDNSWFKFFKEGIVEFSMPANPKGVEDSKMFNIGKNLIVDGKSVGIVLFTVDGDILTDMMYAGKSGTDEAVFLFNSKNEILYSSDSFVYEENHARLADMLVKTSYKDETVFSSRNIHFNAIASKNHGYKLAAGLNLTSINKNRTQVIFATLMYFLMILLLAVLVSLIIAFSLYRSIVDVVTQTAASNDIGEHSENNELTYLSNTLLNTMKNHEKIEDELVEKVTTLKKVQSIALQTQINPHFLFNTLNLVNGFVLEESRGDSRAATMISNLSDILYIALNTKEYIVTAETELEYAKKYLSIEQVKYPGKFHVNYDIEPEALECKTVKFVLQPIIENAIEHGMKKLDGSHGIITIGVAVMNNKLVFSVSDNGPKIPPDKLAELEKRLESEEIQESRHIGLSNVNQRIKLIFGDEYGVSIYSDAVETVIDIVMPEIRN